MVVSRSTRIRVALVRGNFVSHLVSFARRMDEIEGTFAILDVAARLKLDHTFIRMSGDIRNSLSAIKSTLAIVSIKFNELVSLG